MELVLSPHLARRALGSAQHIMPEAVRAAVTSKSSTAVRRLHSITILGDGEHTRRDGAAPHAALSWEHIKCSI
jgi:hypothetical protein